MGYGLGKDSAYGFGTARRQARTSGYVCPDAGSTAFTPSALADGFALDQRFAGSTSSFSIASGTEGAGSTPIGGSPMGEAATAYTLVSCAARLTGFRYGTAFRSAGYALVAAGSTQSTAIAATFPVFASVRSGSIGENGSITGIG